MNPVVHFEMPAEDRNRMASFYTKAFGWRTQMLGEDMGNYVIATTTELDENGLPKRPGAINGGFFQKTKDMPAQYPSVVIAVDDIKESMKKVMDAGGKVLGEPMEIQHRRNSRGLTPWRFGITKRVRSVSPMGIRSRTNGLVTPCSKRPMSNLAWPNSAPPPRHREISRTSDARGFDREHGLALPIYGSRSKIRILESPGASRPRGVS